MAGIADVGRNVARKFNLTNKQGQEMVIAVFEEIAASLEKGENVSIRDFGNFKVTEVAPRTITNPQTGEKVQLDKSTRAILTPGQKLKNRVKHTTPLTTLKKGADEEADAEEAAE